jgi:hypothetical protein
MNRCSYLIYNLFQNVYYYLYIIFIIIFIIIYFGLIPLGTQWRYVPRGNETVENAKQDFQVFR